MKIVYVVTFCDDNYFFEQALVSACSVRRHNPNSEILIVTDNESMSLITGWRNVIYDYVNEIKAFSTPEGYDAMRRSRWLKTSIRNLIDGDFLFIDTDTIVCDSLEGINKFNGDISAVVDMHCNVYKSINYQFLCERFEKVGWPVTEDFNYMNSGVMLVRDTPETRKFFSDWNATWLYTLEKGVHHDQVSLRMTDLKNGLVIKELPGVWNCQVDGNFLPYLHDCHILHYMARSGKRKSYEGTRSLFYFQDNEPFRKIRQYEGIPSDVMHFIENPFDGFVGDYQILRDVFYYEYQKLKSFARFAYLPRRLSILKFVAKFL